MPISAEHRLRCYLGAVACIRHATITETSALRGKTIVCSAKDAPELLRSKVQRAFPLFTPARTSSLYERYVVPMLQIYQALQIDRPFAVTLGDNFFGPSLPSFVRSRSIVGSDLGVIMPLDGQRHFAPMRMVESNDQPFELKDTRLVWRGMTTGGFSVSGVKGRESRFYIPALATRCKDNPQIDVGFTKVVQLEQGRSDIPPSRLRQFVKPTLSMQDQLKSKFLLSLEGNDVASGLKWMLFSNSCVLMPEPKAISWACESFLKPHVHYVPVARDLSDVERVMGWCEDNLSMCRDIARQGKEFMGQFTDPASEERLALKVAGEYSLKIAFE